MKTEDGWNQAEDGRRARHGYANSLVNGGRFWSLSVTLWQSHAWPVDCVTRLMIYETADGTLKIEHGRIFPPPDEDDAA